MKPGGRDTPVLGEKGGVVDDTHDRVERTRLRARLRTWSVTSCAILSE